MTQASEPFALAVHEVAVTRLREQLVSTGCVAMVADDAEAQVADARLPAES